MLLIQLKCCERFVVNFYLFNRYDRYAKSLLNNLLFIEEVSIFEANLMLKKKNL
ncbi:hypothetical protein CCYN49044_390004 [Capnocytophaga cynodegmi]|uniref:Uncharacterized protein n=1 Tax=Capnocytophaga cynodegmi TaxID=28189 RepID=A0A0B7HI73_9FLAO|nr:hypothetical protein CCYN74_250003 [Capnocytophaga cynodegmi]CEN40637.1 hypothetical protein CCYN49044_390004 [Capnocytophaga cynodegmi]